MTTITVLAVAITFTFTVAIIAIIIFALPIHVRDTPVGLDDLLVIRGDWHNPGGRNPGGLHLTHLPLEQDLSTVRAKGPEVEVDFKNWRQITAHELKENGFQYVISRDTLNDKLDALDGHTFEAR
ncbi:unnamed protein product [Fusarium equiseti]|uniref:Uncharacterized protein n=1 Tax=Fusarium equiseti TaxID=61235 RepID=A0A8J2IN35_FUSEQ|nr:unnamed protein product [Fusarium equiseti]